MRNCQRKTTTQIKNKCFLCLSILYNIEASKIFCLPNPGLVCVWTILAVLQSLIYIFWCTFHPVLMSVNEVDNNVSYEPKVER